MYPVLLRKIMNLSISFCTDELDYRHFGKVEDGVDMRAEVGLLTRNIKIQGVMERGCPDNNENCEEFDYDTYGGHIKVLHAFLGHLSLRLRGTMQQVTTTNEPRHDKTNKMSVRPANSQISLGIRPVWSESSQSAWRNLGSLATHWAHSEDSDQTGRMPSLIWVFAGRTLILLVLSCRGSNLLRIS